MEMEITIFKFANEYLKRNKKTCKCWTWYICSILMFLVCTALFVYANVQIIPNNHYIQQCEESLNKFKRSSQSIGVIYSNIFSASIMKDFQDSLKKFNISSNKLVDQSEKCSVYKNIYTRSTIQNKVQFTNIDGLLTLSSRTREQLNIQNYTYFLKTVPNSLILLYNFHLFKANQLLSESVSNNETIYISTSSGSFSSQKHYQTSKFTIFKGIIGSFIFYGASSILLQLFVKELLNIWLILFAICQHIFRPRQEAFITIKQLAPWIGMKLAQKETATDPKYKNNNFWFYFPYFLQLILFYFLFQTIFWAFGFQLLYLNEAYFLIWVFFDLYFVQFFGLVFLRNPLSLKYFPILHMFNINFVIIYIQFGQIGCEMLVILMGLSLDFLFLHTFIMFIETPSLDDENGRFKPTENQPRFGLMPVYNVNWVSLQQDIWTFMMPLFDKNSSKSVPIKSQRFRQYMVEQND